MSRNIWYRMINFFIRAKKISRTRLAFNLFGFKIRKMIRNCQ